MTDVNPLPLDAREALLIDMTPFITGPPPPPGPPLTRDGLQAAIARLIAARAPSPGRPRYIVCTDLAGPAGDVDEDEDEEREWAVGDRVQVWELQPDGTYRQMEGDTHVTDVTYR